MRILVIGAGAREHALAEKILASPMPCELYWLPGNGALQGRVTQVRDIDPNDGPSLATYAQRMEIDLAVIGPEAPLLAGVSDCLREVGIPCFGPSKAAAQLEGSKAFAKELMVSNNIPTARYQLVAGQEEALRALENWQAPVVIKADGLAAGKGVTVAQTLEEARAAASALTGPAVIEEYLEGEELSFMVLAQGREYVLLAPSRDYKRVGDNGTGPNTGGMGAVSSFELVDHELQHEICNTIITPTLTAMDADGRPFSGVLYAGLMLTKAGPKVLEFNVRFGDPEAQAILSLWEDDLLKVLLKVAKGELPRCLTWSKGVALTMVLAAEGYPGKPRTGDEIAGLDQLPTGVTAYQGGTAWQDDKLVTNGGRVLSLTTAASDVETARKQLSKAVAQVSFPGMHHRNDIGL
ncbi:MAG: phosphoribosylamine--glycine ligase [Firmicutes bacterium]|nr:phosphoribosylamine--glycine ligase [Bacillota bacterium]